VTEKARIDHAVVAVRDLDRAGRWMEETFGLGSVEGGVHPAWGTANRIVPLGQDYIELLAVADSEVAARSPLGRATTAATEHAEHALLTWCMACPDAGAVAERLSLPVTAGSRRRSDGVELRWRLAGLDAALAEPGLPFFITWEVAPDQHPGRMRVEHLVRPSGIDWLEVGVDVELLGRWFGDFILPVGAVPGPSGLAAVAVATEKGELVIR
jgi:hypothetical protein